MKFDMQKAKELRVRVDNLREQTIQCSEFDIVLASSLLPAAIDRIEELEAIVTENKKRWAAWMNTTDQRTIEKLEKSLVEERAKGDLGRLFWPSLAKGYKELALIRAREQLVSEGLL